MRHKHHRSFARGCHLDLFIFPSRADLTSETWSCGVQRPRHPVARGSSRGCSASRWPITRVLTAVALSAFPVTASSCFETAAFAQNLSRLESIDGLAEFTSQASTRFAVPARWIRAVIQVESAGDEHAISAQGAMGLMQLMPGTWVDLSIRYGLGPDPFDRRDNILAGAAYLKEMLDRFGSAGFLAAYHAGPARYEQHLVTGKPLPPDTLAYVAAVTPLLGKEQVEHAAVDGRRVLPWREAPLFVERAGAL
jgi:hypothetical protein